MSYNNNYDNDNSSHYQNETRINWNTNWSYLDQESTNIDLQHRIPSSAAWRNHQSDYFVSSPSTSSGSSSHSQSRSPEQLDTIINFGLDISDARTEAAPSSIQFSKNRDISDIWSGHNYNNNNGLYDASPTSWIPENKSTARSSCRGCNNMSCPTCVMRRFRISNLTRVIDSIVPQIKSPRIVNSMTSPDEFPIVCDAHPNAQRFYCQTCFKSLCGVCGITSHNEHVTEKLEQAIEGANSLAIQVLSEALRGMTLLEKDLCAVQAAKEMLDEKSIQAGFELRAFVKRAVAALLSQEAEMMDRLSKLRNAKLKELEKREAQIKDEINRLTCATDNLQLAMKSSFVSINPMDLLLYTDLLSAEIFQVRQTHQALPPLEQNWINVNISEHTVMKAIANLGSVTMNHPGAIGDRRAVRGRGNSPQLFAVQASPPFASVALPVTNTSEEDVEVARCSDRLPSVTIGNNPLQPELNLCRPWGVACDKEGHLVIADRSNNRILVFEQNGTFLRQFGTVGPGLGQLNRPAGITIDVRRRIVVVDKDNHRVQAFTLDGTFLLSFGERGQRCGQFNYPWDISSNSHCQMVVSDTRNHRIQMFGPSGVFLRKFGYESNSPAWKPLLDSPRGVAFNPQGHIVLTDFNNHKILIVDSEFMRAEIFRCEGSSDVKLLQRPQGVVVDDRGNIIVADCRNHRIQVFDPNGALKWRWGKFGNGEGEMDRPSGIAVCDDGRIAVIDFGNNRLLIF